MCERLFDSTAQRLTNNQRLCEVYFQYLEPVGKGTLLVTISSRRIWDNGELKIICKKIIVAHYRVLSKCFNCQFYDNGTE